MATWANQRAQRDRPDWDVTDEAWEGSSPLFRPYLEKRKRLIYWLWIAPHLETTSINVLSSFLDSVAMQRNTCNAGPQQHPKTWKSNYWLSDFYFRQFPGLFPHSSSRNCEPSSLGALHGCRRRHPEFIQAILTCCRFHVIRSAIHVCHCHWRSDGPLSVTMTSWSRETSSVRPLWSRAAKLWEATLWIENYMLRVEVTLPWTFLIGSHVTSSKTVHGHVPRKGSQSSFDGWRSLPNQNSRPAVIFCQPAP